MWNKYNELDLFILFPNLNVWVQIGKCFDYVPQIFQITYELHGSPFTIALPPKHRPCPRGIGGRLTSGTSLSHMHMVVVVVPAPRSTLHLTGIGGGLHLTMKTKKRGLLLCPTSQLLHSSSGSHRGVLLRVPPLGRDAPRDPRALPSWVMGWESRLPVFSE